MTNQYDHKALVNAAKKAPYLERDEEHKLAVRWHEEQDQQSLHTLTTAHMRLVIAMAMKFKNFGLPLSDLIQEGHIGLLQAASRFDPYRDIRFSTYATWWIRASMQEYILRNWSIVRSGTSSKQKALFFQLRRLKARLAQNSGRDTETADFNEIAAALDVPKDAVAEMDARLSGDLSLNIPIVSYDESGAERQDLIESNEPRQDEIVEHQIDSERRREWLERAMTGLNDRERYIVQHRHLSDDSVTLESLGQHFGVSKERVRQVESRALEKLKSLLLAQQPRADSFV